MLKLPDVTLIAMTGIGYKPEEHKKAFEKSREGIEWGEIKLIQLAEIVDVDSWNKAIIYELPKYIDTKFCMLIHHDGYVIHPELWNDEWLNYDYIGAPWPLPTDDYSYRDEEGKIQRVGNSVSLRSNALMMFAAQREWKSYYGNTNEDGFICCHNRNWLEEMGMVFAPLTVARYFSKEHEVAENVGLSTFAFHSL